MFFRASQGRCVSFKISKLRHAGRLLGLLLFASTIAILPYFKHQRYVSESAELPVHFVRFYKSTPDPLCYLECVAVLAVLKNLKPSRIYVHTNQPDFWPFTTCNDVIKTWVPVHMVYRQRIFAIYDKLVDNVSHQADIAKLQVIKEHGGVVLDLDIFIIQGFRIAEILQKYECIVGSEGPGRMNGGFLACGRKDAEWPTVLLEHFEKDYQVGWLYNTAYLPFRVYNESERFQKLVYVDRTISDNPPGEEKDKVLYNYGLVDWRSKIGYHTHFNDCGFNATNVTASDSSFGAILRWIIDL